MVTITQRAVLGLALLVTTACGPKQKGTYAVDAASGSANDALVAEADALWEKRGDKESLQSALVKYEAAYTANPRDRHVAGRLVRGWYFLADAHTMVKDQKLAHWDTAINWGKKCLAINDEFKAQIASGAKEADAIGAANKDDVPCLYWTASSLGKWAKGYGIAKALKHKDTIVAYITRVSELQPDYFYGASDRYWGAYYSVLPSFAGQDLDLSKTHFDKSIEIAPGYLGTRVLMAENWAVKSQAKPVFLRNLKLVLEADPDAIPEIAPENRAEQAKAKALLEQTDDLFR